jgi:hypothetical protein
MKLIKNKYPKDFYSYLPPYPPSKPQEWLGNIEISTAKISNYDSISIPEGATEFYLEASTYNEYGSIRTDICVTFYSNQKLPNLKYDEQIKKYELELTKYEEKLKEWKKYKKLWDDEQKQKKDEIEKKQYNRLKKKFEGKN